MPRSSPRRSPGKARGVKLVKVVRSPRKEKKWRAVFRRSTGKEYSVDFGAAGMQDYTQHKDPQRRKNYVSRHTRDLRTRDPTRAGFLSMEVLWGSSTSLKKNLAAYKRKHGL